MSLETVDLHRLPLNTGQRVLDLGCGEGRHAITAYLHADVQVIGLDLSRGDIDIARGRFSDFEDPNAAGKSLDFIVGSGLTLPFADASFDRVICSEVLEHIHNYQAVLREIQRVLKPGGLLALSVPRFAPEWICWKLSDAYHEVEGGHVRIFRRKQLKDAAEHVDMVHYATHGAHALHVPYWWLRCLFWGNENAAPVRLYHRLLVWDLMSRPRLTRWLDRLLNPWFGKSIVMYFVRGLT
ncbi:MAG: class I SAM-dependent methyltransferase [Gammaproteobacteria bacterium]|nr:MAG: class I SAM-dependent methyltransferase [Gammaproteobacteria bacterium]